MRGAPAPTSRSSPTRSATTTGSAGKFLNAGLGFGGGCLPKDIRAFMARAGELGADQALTFLREVDAINMRRRVRMVDLAREVCGGSLLGRRVAVLGAAFKPDSDDVRDSPALDVAAQHAAAGRDVAVTDPAGDGATRSRAAPDLTYVDDRATRPLTGADVVLLLTEWREYRDLDPARFGRTWSADSASWTAATRSTRSGGARPAGPTGPWVAGAEPFIARSPRSDSLRARVGT